MAIRFWLGVMPSDTAAWARHTGRFEVPAPQRGLLSQLREADGLVLYSPRTTRGDEYPLRDFTAIGRINDGVVFRTEGITVPGEIWRPYGVAVDWDPGVTPVPLLLMKRSLDFTNQWNWGERLRDGIIEISRNDFLLLRDAMLPGDPEDRARV